MICFESATLGRTVKSALLCAALGLLVGCGSRGDESASESDDVIQIKADWYAQPTHSGFYLALVNGYYEKAGLNVSVAGGGPNDNVRQKVAQGEIAIGVGRLEDIIMAVDRGLPLVAVGAYLQRIPLSFMVHADQGIEHVRDIGERPVMATAGSLFLARLEALHDVSLNTIPHMRTIARFVTDKELVQQCYLTNEPYFVAKAGVEAKVLPLYEAGLDSIRVMYCRRSLVEERPEDVMKAVAVSHRGWADYIADGDGYVAAHEEIQVRNPKLDLEFMAWARQQIIDRGIVTGPSSEVEALRSISPERTQAMIDELLDLGLIKQRYASEEIVDWGIVNAVLEKPIPVFE